MTVPARLTREQRRDQLIALARDIFGAHGYHATTMDDIATAAGVTKPIVYQHFSSKKDLYRALIEQHTGDLLSSITTALATTNNNKQRVSALVTTYFEFIDAEPAGFRLIFAGDLADDPDVAGVLHTFTQRCTNVISQVISTDTGLDAAQARVLATALIGMAYSSARQWLVAPTPVPLTRAVDLVTQVAWRGIAGFPLLDFQPERGDTPS